MDTDGTGWGDGGSRIDVEQFDYESLDALEDRIREAIAKGESVAPLVRQLTAMETNEAVCEAIAAVICYIADAEKPGLAADYLAWISGMRIRQGTSLPKLAAHHGMSKQAFCQAAIRLAAVLRIKPARAMRSDLARAVMRRAHFKRVKHGTDKAT